ncbi:MAG: hypothetical protein AAF922_13290 [Pseudomonadota bacterium]
MKPQRHMAPAAALFVSVSVAAGSLAADSVAAPSLLSCTRTTHISHGGEDMHQDLGEGRVMWREWWSQEGTATDFVIVDCEPGEGLRFRTSEENMGARTPFDRTEAALDIVSTHERGSRIFATLDRIAEDLDGTARDVALYTLSSEPCACAALYASLRGAKQAYDPKG